jgi:hypothetical protein
MLLLVLGYSGVRIQYLLQAIESRPGRVGLTDHELKQLLSDVKDGRVRVNSSPFKLLVKNYGQDRRAEAEASILSLYASCDLPARSGDERER